MSHKASKTKKAISKAFEEDYGMASDEEDSNFEYEEDESEEDDDDGDMGGLEEEEDCSDSDDNVEESEEEDSSDEESEDEDSSEKKIELYNKLIEFVKGVQTGLISEENIINENFQETIKECKTYFKDLPSAEWTEQIFIVLEDVVKLESVISTCKKEDRVVCFFSGKTLQGEYVTSKCIKPKFNPNGIFGTLEVHHPKDPNYQNIDLSAVKNSDIVSIKYHSVFHPFISTITNINDMKSTSSPWYDKYSAEQIASTYVKASEHVKRCLKAIAF